MTNQLHFQIADLTFTVETDLPLKEIGLPGRLSPFVVSKGYPREQQGAVIRREETCHLETLPVEDMIYDPGRVWRMYNGCNGFDSVIDIDYTSRCRTGSPGARLFVNKTWDRALLKEKRAPRRRSWSTILDLGPAELMIRTRIIFNDGLVFHACGLDDNGRGLLIAGRSGAGKTTQRLIWTQESGVIVLNDDRAAMRLNKEGAMIYGTPWGGVADTACSRQAPLKAILLIEKAKKNVLIPVPPAMAMPLLAARAFLPYWSYDLMAAALGVLERLVNRIPVYRLRCLPEAAVIPFVRAAL